MPRVILAEDSRTQAAVIRITLESKGFQVQICRDGAEALKAVAQDPPDLVLTDLDMPELDGVGLVKALKSDHPAVPAIIMHTSGSEQSALAALRSGAVDYVMKRSLADEIDPAYRRLRNVQAALSQCVPPSPHLIEATHSFLLDNDAAAIQPLIAHLHVAVASTGVWDDNDRLRFCIAAREAIQNAMHQNNLELPGAPFETLADESECLGEGRRKERPYYERRVRVAFDVSRSRFKCTIEDQGRPLNHAAAEAAVKTSLERHHGLVLLTNFMDQTSFESAPNRMVFTNGRA